MRHRNTYLVVLLILILSCSSNRSFRYTNEEFIGPKEFTFFEQEGHIEFEVVHYYRTNLICQSHAGTAFGLFIGKVRDNKLSDTISFLAPCEYGEFKEGQVLRASLNKKFSSSKAANIMYSEISNKRKITRLMGAQYPAFWCNIQIADN